VTRQNAALTTITFTEVTMAPSNLFQSLTLLQAPTPYTHELNYNGTACAHHCPACRWIRRTSDAPWSDAVLNSDADDSRYVALALRLYWEHIGMIEGNFADLDVEGPEYGSASRPTNQN